MDKLTIGQMAKLHRVSEKTLRHYHEMGILVPELVNEQNGYRYYSLLQSAQLDMIQQMKSIGLSLQEIRSILENKDVDYLYELLERQLEIIKEEQRRLKLVAHTTEQLLNTCRIYKSEHICNIVAVEKQSRRRIIRFPIRSYALDESFCTSKSAERAWETSLRRVKNEFIQRGIPLTFFHNVGCIISREDLERRRVIISGAFIFIDEDFAVENSEILPEGDYLTVLLDSLSDENGNCLEPKFIERLLDFSKKEGYRIAGDYYGEVLAETPAFLFEGRDTMVKMQIPVSVAQ